MRTKGIRTLPVVNDEGGLEEILTIDDVLELLSEELSLLAKAATRGQEQEMKLKPYGGNHEECPFLSYRRG